MNFAFKTSLILCHCHFFVVKVNNISEIQCDGLTKQCNNPLTTCEIIVVNFADYLVLSTPNCNFYFFLFSVKLKTCTKQLYHEQ